MAVHITTNQDLFTKLSTTSIAFKAALAKLLAYQVSKVEDKRLNDEFFGAYLAAYCDNEEDLMFAETFSDISLEADNTLMEKGNLDA